MGSEPRDADDQKRVQVAGLFETEGSESSGVYTVQLRDEAGRAFHILVDACAAFAIRMALDDGMMNVLRRPLTHDLMQHVLTRFGAKLERVLIDDVSEHTYFAKLVLSEPKGAVEVDARPSDAIALALRAGAPIFAHESVIVRTLSGEGETNG